MIYIYIHDIYMYMYMYITSYLYLSYTVHQYLQINTYPHYHPHKYSVTWQTSWQTVKLLCQVCWMLFGHGLGKERLAARWLEIQKKTSSVKISSFRLAVMVGGLGVCSFFNRPSFCFLGLQFLQHICCYSLFFSVDTVTTTREKGMAKRNRCSAEHVYNPQVAWFAR